MDLHAGTCLTAKACTLLHQHRRLVGCGSDPEVLKAAEPDLLSTFASQVLSPHFYIGKDEEVGAASLTLKKRVAEVSACRRAASRKFPLELDAVQVVPRHIWHLPSTLQENYGLYGKWRHIPLSM